MRNILDCFFYPESVALIGASRDPGKASNQMLRSLIQGGFPGKVFPVNPREETIMGVHCYPSLKDIPHPVELVVICIPATQVLEAMEQAKCRRELCR